MKKIILLLGVILIFSGVAVFAWNPNPLYAPFEVIWNAINNLQDEVDEQHSFTDFSYLLDQMAPEMKIPFEAIQPFTCGSSFTLYVDGADLGRVIGFVGKESISSPYEYHVAIQTPSLLNISQYINKTGRLVFTRNGNQSWFTGLVTEFGFASYDGTNAIYDVKIVPHLYLLSYDSGYSSYINSRYHDIVNMVLNSAGLIAVYMLAGSYPVHEHTLQYSETDLNFISRLMEHEGISYYFEHDSGGENLIFTDRNTGFLDPADLQLDYKGHMASPSSTGEEFVRTFHRKERLSTKSVRVNSYDYEPVMNHMAVYSAPDGVGELYEFIPGLKSGAESSLLARSILEQIQTERWLTTGTSTSPDLRAGTGFQLNDISGGSFSGDYLITSVRHGVIIKDGCYAYGNEFETIPFSIPFRPEKKTPKPKVNGVETARVTNNLNFDSLGEVKVQYHWGQESNWIRVASPYPGTNESMEFIPLVDREVVVAFERGDPDSPVIIGSVYNGLYLAPEIPDDTGLNLSCISKQLSYSQAAGTWTNLQIHSGPGTDSSTRMYCGAGYSVFQARCVSGGGASTIHLNQAGIYTDHAICTYFNSGASPRAVYIQAKCCEGSW